MTFLILIIMKPIFHTNPKQHYGYKLCQIIIGVSKILCYICPVCLHRRIFAGIAQLVEH